MTTDAETPPVTDPSAYHFVEFAFGGLDKRGQFADLHTLRVGPKVTDAYTSVYGFSEKLRAYAERNRRTNGEPDPKGKPSVKDYPDACLPRGVHYDLDAPDPTLALTDARRIVRRLVDDFDVDAAAIRIFFSGGKGFHIEIPAALFGGFAPSTAAPARIKRLAQALIAALTVSTFDANVYDKTRLWRVPGTRHGKTGLLKTPLTVAELLSLTLEEIKTLAATPRTVAVVPDDEWLPRPELVALWQETDQPEEVHTPRAAPDPCEAADALTQRLGAAMLAEVWPDAGARHQAALALAGGLAHAGWQEDAIAAFTINVAARAMGAESDPREDEWQRGARTTIARVQEGKPVIGWPTLAAHIGAAPVAAVRSLFGILPPAVIFGSARTGHVDRSVPEDLPFDTESPCVDQLAAKDGQITYWRDRALQAESLVAEMQTEQSLAAQIRRNKAIKAAAPAVVAALNFVDSEVRRGQTDEAGFVRAPMVRIAEAAGGSSKRVSEHIAEVGEPLGLFERKRKVEHCSPTTGELYSQPVVVTWIRPLVPKLEGMRRLASYEAPEAPGWGGKREKGLSCTAHPDSELIQNTYCLTCKRLVKQRTIHGSGDSDARTGQDDPSGDDHAGEAAPAAQSTYTGQDDPSVPRRHNAGWGNPPDGWNVCATPDCNRLTRAEVCTACDARFGGWGTREDESRAWAEASS